MPEPASYKNGENVTALTDAQNEIIEVEVEGDSDSDNDTSLVTDKSQPSEPIDVPSKVNSNVNTDISDAINTDINSNDESKTINEPSLRSNYQRFTSDLTDKIKKVIWRAVPENQEISLLSIEDNAINQNAENTDKNNSTEKNDAKDNSKSNNKENAKDNGETANTPRKEGLFSKHLKKAKTEPTRPLPKYAVLAVIDEGDGIPENKREEVFSPFVRLQQKNKGSGLGLSLVAQIVTAHQGRILTDTINGHTRFLVVLPVKHDPHYHHDSHN